MIKVKLHVMLVLHNMWMEPSNVKKKIELLNMTKVLLNVMLVLLNMTMEPLNVRKKKKGTTKSNKRIVTCDVGTAQCEDETVKCEKKNKRPPNVTKKLSYVMLELHNMRIKLSNVIKELSHVILELHNVRMKSSNVMFW